jgi:hypothetical protein
MKKYYVSTVIGDGTEFNPYRPQLSDSGVNHVAVINQAVKPWALCLVSAQDHDVLEVAGNDPMPEFPLDAKMSAMGIGAKTAMNAKLNARNITQPNNPDAYREIIRSIGQQIDPAFSEDNFDVA